MTMVKVPSSEDQNVEAEVLTIHVAVGDEVAHGEVLVEIGFDKVDMEIPAPHDARVVEILVSEGDVLAPDSDLLVLDP